MKEQIAQIIFQAEQFEASETINKIVSLNEIIESLTVLFDQINQKLDQSEESIKKINFGALFKQELDQIALKINENIEFLIELIKKSTKKVDKLSRQELSDFNDGLKTKLSNVQQLLQNIIQKTPEMPEQISIFKEYRKAFKENITNSINKIKNNIEILSRDINEIVTMRKGQSTAALHEFQNFTDSHDTEFSVYKKEIDELFSVLELNKAQLEANEEQLKTIEEQIRKYESIFSEMILKIDEEVNMFQKLSKEKVKISSLKEFETNKVNLKNLIYNASEKAEEIEEFAQEISVGSVFSDDVDLLNDEIYDNFVPLIKDIEVITEKSDLKDNKTFNNLRLEFKDKIAKTQAVLDIIVKKAPTNITSQVEMDASVNTSLFPEAKKLFEKIADIDIILLVKGALSLLFDPTLKSLNDLKNYVESQKTELLLNDQVYNEKLNELNRLKREEEERLKREEEERLKREEEERLKREEEERLKREEEERLKREEEERLKREEEERLKREEEERLKREEEERPKREEEEQLKQEEDQAIPAIELKTKPSLVRKVTPLKIILIGLGRVGKSSYVEILQQRFGTLYSVLPTGGVKQRKLKIWGHSINIWDFGGQKQFRDHFLQYHEKYLKKTDLFFFMVNLQAMDELDISFDYYQKLIGTPELRKLDPYRILIFIHKSDPDEMKRANFENLVKRIKKKFDTLKKEVTYFYTTILDYWTVVNSFSQAIKRIIPIEAVILKIIKEFARATFSSGVVLLEENFIIIEKHARNTRNLKITKDALAQILNEWATLAASGETDSRIQIEIEVGRAYLQKFSFDDEQSLFVMCFSRNTNTEKLVIEKLPQLARHIYEVRAGYAADNEEI